MPRRPRKRHVQTSFAFAAPDPRRGKAGRKPKGDKAGVPHTPRAHLTGRHPVHVTLHVRDEVPNLRRNRLLGLLTEAMRAGSDRFGFRLCHYSVMGNHIHLIVEADDTRALSRGVQGLSIRLARRINGANGQRGRFFSDRYHARVLLTPTDVNRTIIYVLLNHRKHARERGYRPPEGVDAFSSGAWFDGWNPSPRGLARVRRGEPPVATPRGWLLREGWRRAGPISPDAYAP